jgi:hypothetical protein
MVSRLKEAASRVRTATTVTTRANTSGSRVKREYSSTREQTAEPRHRSPA